MNVNRDHNLVPWDTIYRALRYGRHAFRPQLRKSDFFTPLTVSLCDYHGLTLEEARQQLNDHTAKLKGTMDFTGWIIGTWRQRSTS